MLKKYKKNWKRRKFAMLIIPIITMPLIAFSLLSYLKVGAEMEYKLITDLNGIRWQYGFNPSSNTLEVSFYDSENAISEVTIPERDFFISNDSSISEIDNYVFTNYAYHVYDAPETFVGTITKLDLSSADTVNGVSPLVNPTTLTEIILNPDGSAIGQDAFRNRKIDIKNLDEVTSIGGGAFYNTEFENTILKLDYLTELGDGSFEKSNIMQVELNPEEIGVSAFKNCTSLATVKLLNNVKTIKDAAFEGDINLELIDLNNVETIGSRAFKFCTSFNQDLKDTKITTIGTEAFAGATGFSIPVTMPNGVTTLGYKAFHNTNITKVNLNNVVTVGLEAFSDNAYLTDIDFGKTEVIYYKAFFNCTSLTDIVFSDTVRTINEYAFSSCNIENIDFANVETIFSFAFEKNQIKELNINSKAIIKIHPHSFNDNPTEKAIIGFDTTRTLNNQSSCLFIQLGVNTSLNLKTVEFIAPYDENDEIPNDRYYNPISIASVSNTSEEASTAMSNKNVIASGFLYLLPNLEEIIIGEGYEFLGAMQTAQFGTNLKKVVLPSTLKGIGSYAFMDSFNEYTEIDMDLPDSLEYIGAYAFMYSYGFHEEVDIDNLKFVGINAFMASGITKFVFHENLTTISTASLYNCKYLKELVMDCDFFAKPYAAPLFHLFQTDRTSTDYIDHTYDLIKFTDKVVTNPNTIPIFSTVHAKTIDLSEAKVTTLGSSAFVMTHLDTLILPKNLETIGYSSFYRSFITNEVEMPKTVTMIDSNAFLSSSIRIDALPENLVTIGYAAFFDCPLADDIVIPRTVTYIGSAAFGGYRSPYSQGSSNTFYEPNSNTMPVNNLINRKSVTFLNSLTGSMVANQTISSMFTGTLVEEMIFGNNVAELPTQTINIGRTLDASSCEFYGLGLKKVTFKNLKKVPKKAFLDCTSLVEIDFSKDTNLEEIGELAFFDAYSLEKVKLHKNSDFTIQKLAFFNSGLKSIGPEDSGLDLVNNKVTITDYFTFQSMSNLRYLELNNNFNNGVITAFSFDHCMNLDTIILHEDITKIEVDAFKIYEDLYNSGSCATTGYYNYSTNNIMCTDYNYTYNHSLVIFGNPIIETRLANGDKNISVSGFSNYYIDIDNDFNYLKNEYTNWSVVTTYNNSTTTVNSSNFTSSTSVSISASSSYTVNFTLNDPEDSLYLDLKNYSSYGRIYVRRKDKKDTTSKLNLYCYSNSTNVINYYQEHKDEFNKYNDEDKNPSLYYLDEVVHLDANKKNVEMNSNNSDIIKDGLILYALRRDGILMVSDENGHYQYAVNYKESDITLPSYHPTTEDPSKRVFYTTQKPADLNVASTENFNSITYRIGEYDPETDRIYVAYEYTNSIGNQEVVTNVFKTKGNYADIVYSDGCDEDAFATITYTNVLIGDEAPTLEDFTPEREGYEFLGWDKEIETTTTGDVVYTAQWRKIEVPEEDDEDDYYDPMPEDLPDPMEGFINPKTGVTLLLLIPLIASIIFITKLKRKRVQA